MTTRDVVAGYLECVRNRGEWESMLSDTLVFTNYTHPVKRSAGKAASIEGIRRFYAMVKEMEIEGMIVDGNRACAFVRYTLQPPGGDTFDSHIAEVFEVSDNEIHSFGIYFDSVPYPRPRPADA